MRIRDRIKELRRVRAGDLLPNPRNWRTHPKDQQDALRGILAEVGYADALLARERQDGTLELVDGHLRAETTPEEIVPVLVLDVTESEANKLLTVLDPLASLAEANKDALASLVKEFETAAPALQKMVDDLARENKIEAGGDVIDAEPQIDRAAELQAEWGTAAGAGVDDSGQGRRASGDVRGLDQQGGRGAADGWGEGGDS